MYAWIWQKLPGAWPFKVLESVVAGAAIVALLFIVVFPAVEPNLPFINVTIDESTTPSGSSTPAVPSPVGPVTITPAPLPT